MADESFWGSTTVWGVVSLIGAAAIAVLVMYCQRWLDERVRERDLQRQSLIMVNEFWSNIHDLTYPEKTGSSKALVLLESSAIPKGLETIRLQLGWLKASDFKTMLSEHIDSVTNFDQSLRKAAPRGLAFKDDPDHPGEKYIVLARSGLDEAGNITERRLEKLHSEWQRLETELSA